MMAMIFSKLPGAQEITFEDVVEEQQSLPKLIQKGEFEEIKTYFESNPTEVNYVARLGKYEQCSLLYLAISSAREDVVQYLLEKKPKLNGKNGKEKETALHRAVRALQVKTVHALIASGASSVTKDRHGLKPLCIATRMYKESKSAEVRKKAETIVRALRGNRIIRPFRSETGNSENSVEKLVAELKSTVKIEETSNDDINPGMAIVVNNPLMLDRYLENGDPNFVNDRGYSLLEIALQCSKTSERNYYVERLLKAKADPNKPLRFGLTPLHRAVQEQSLFLVRILLNHGADSTLEDKHRRIPVAMVDKIPKRLRNKETIANLEMVLCAAQQRTNLDIVNESLEKVQLIQSEPAANSDDLTLNNLNLSLP